ncbi:hypothetical protein GOODEAATRI_005493 [Goodea atripinnis]|uniref:Autophagy-related protein 9 n=1 Tax=Goodea atripinnis TaxID=208336 RepID=A0ABV0NJ79_9TELE
MDVCSAQWVSKRMHGSLFENEWSLKPEYKRGGNRLELADRLASRILWIGIANLLLCPVILVWQILYAFFMVAKNVAFFAGSLLAVLIALTIYDEDVLAVEHVLSSITLLGICITICRSFIPDKHMVFCPEQLLRVILAHIHYMPDHWQGNAHRYETRDQFSQLFQYKAVFILEELLSPLVTPIILIFCLRRKSLEIIDFFRNFTVEWMSEGKTEASIYQQAEDGKTELSLMHFAITNPHWQPPRETTHFISQLKERVHREAAGASSDTHPLSLSESEVRQESDESSDSIPDEVRSEPNAHSRNFPRSHTFPTTLTSPGASPASASATSATTVGQDGAKAQSSTQRRHSGPAAGASGKVVRTARMPMGGWAEGGKASSRHHEPLQEETSEDELPPHIHKVNWHSCLLEGCGNSTAGVLLVPHRPVLLDWEVVSGWGVLGTCLSSLLATTATCGWYRLKGHGAVGAAARADPA